MKKTPKQLSDEELLQILETGINPTSTALEPDLEYNSDIAAFISLYNLEQGKTLVSRNLLYDIYQQWSSQPMSSEAFTRTLSKYFLAGPVKKNQAFFHINQKGINLTKKAYQYYQKKNKPSTLMPNYKVNFDAFCKTMDIKPGNIWLEDFVLFNLYDQYKFENKPKYMLSHAQFLTFCDFAFNRKIIIYKKRRFNAYQVSKSIYNNITRERVLDLRRTMRKNGKEKNKKKQNKASSTSSGIKPKN